MIRIILVPLDGSDLSERAIPTAVDIARRASARLHLVRVHVPPPVYVDGTDLTWLDAQSRADAAEYLDEVKTRVRFEYAMDATTELLEGKEGRAISEEAAHGGADLIVMTTHGRTGLSRLWLGSVAEWVARHAAVPVLLLKGASTDTPVEVATLGNVFIPLDGSPASESVLSPAMTLGALFRSRYVLLRIVNPVLVASGVFPFGDVTTPPERTDVEDQVERAERYLHTVADRMRMAGVRGEVATRAQVELATADAILAQATSGGADLIAMTTHAGRAGRLLFGSVSDKVLRGSNVPVLLYGPPAT